jgi:Coatomer epsilon subunit
MSSAADHHHHQQPDELYTLRTQYMLGHYTAALQEAKQMSRRPMSSNALKMEREEYIYRCYIALQQYEKCVMSADGSSGSPGTYYTYIIYIIYISV